MSMHDMQGNIIEVNEKGRDILKYKAEEVNGLNLRNLIPEERSSFIDAYLDRIAEHGEDSGMMILKRKDGEWIYWLYNNILEKDQDGNPYVVSSALNMTDRILLEKDLQHTKQIFGRDRSGGASRGLGNRPEEKCSLLVRLYQIYPWRST